MVYVLKDIILNGNEAKQYLKYIYSPKVNIKSFEKKKNTKIHKNKQFIVIQIGLVMLIPSTLHPTTHSYMQIQLCIGKQK